jgi:hypothetical protein
MGDKVYLGSGKLRALLLFSLLVLGDTETKVAKMLPIKGFGDPDFHTFGFGVLDQHANPSRSLQSCPVTSHQLEYGHYT